MLFLQILTCRLSIKGVEFAAHSTTNHRQPASQSATSKSLQQPTSPAPTDRQPSRRRRSTATSTATMAATPVTIEPAAVQIPASGGTMQLQLQNTNAEVRYAFKIKSTNNDQYRVNPVFGFVEPGVAGQVELTRLDGPAKTGDRLEVLFLPVAAEETDPKAPFAGGASPEFKLDVPVAAE